MNPLLPSPLRHVPALRGAGSILVAVAIASEAHAAPPGTLTLDLPDVVLAGESIEGTLTGTLGAGQVIQVLAGSDGEGAGPCSAQFGVCLGVTGKIRVVDRVELDGISPGPVVIRATKDGGRETGSFQAVFRGDAQVGPTLSNVETVTYLPNSAPEVVAVSLVPEEPYAWEDIVAVASFSDAEGHPLEVRYRWFVDGDEVQFGSSDTLPAYSFAKHQRVSVEVTAKDLYDISAPYLSADAVVQNSVPVAGAAHILVDGGGGVATSDSTLTCAPDGPLTDADGDALTTTYAWTVNGTVVGASETLTSGTYVRGDTVRCTLTVTDGEAEVVSVAETEIANAAPRLASASLSPSAPREEDLVTVTLGGVEDGDGDPMLLMRLWYVNGVYASNADVLTGAFFDKGDTIYAVVSPFDGVEWGLPVRTDEVVAVNTPPVVTDVSVDPSDANTSTVLSAVAPPFDADGDPVTVRYDWYVDGSLVATGPIGTLDGSASFDRDQEVYVVVTPSDDDGEGPARTSPVLVVRNAPPSAPLVEIAPAAPLAGEALTCAVVADATDADGDAVSYQFEWTVDGVVYAGASDGTMDSRVDGSAVGRGELWSCVARAVDGAGGDTPSDAATVTTSGDCNDPQDADCDGTVAADDCDDDDPTSTIRAEDADCDGWLTGADCNDAAPTVYPGAPELCDTLDNDCNNVPDEGCQVCGNAVVDPGEECDVGAANSDTAPNTCRTDCLDPSCGDGVVDAGEACDDNNTLAGDGCDAVCQRESCVLTGDQSGVLTKAMSPCLVVGDLKVPAGATWVIEAGTVLKFQGGRVWNSNDTDLVVEGTLRVEGTPTDPVWFTAHLDDTVSGDTNGDGNATTPKAGDWGRLRFQGSGTGSLSHLNVRYGGGGNSGVCCTAEPATDGAVSIGTVTVPPIDHLDVRHSQADGLSIEVTGGFWTTITNSTFSNNTTIGLDLNAFTGPLMLQGLIADANVGRGLEITASGAVTLHASSTDANGGDGIYVQTPGVVTLTDTLATDHPTYGLNLHQAGSDSVVAGNLFQGNHTAVRVVPVLVEQMVNDNTLLDTARGLRVSGGTIDRDTTWPEPGYVYVMEGDMTVAAGTTLVIDPGAIFKFIPGRAWNYNDGDITVDGTLRADGTPTAPIVFTSLYDDRFGGDTNVDGVATWPARGDWGRIRFPEANGSSLSEAIVRFGGGGNSGVCCTAEPATDASVSAGGIRGPTLDALLVEQSQARGLYMNLTGGFTSTVTDSVFQDNGTAGVEIVHGLGPLVLDTLDLLGNGGDGLVATTGGDLDLTGIVSQDNGVDGATLSVGGVLTGIDLLFEGHSAGIGLDALTADAGSTLTNATFVDNGRPAYIVPNLVETTLDPSNTLLDTAPGVWVYGGSLEADSQWPDPGYPYVLTGDLTVLAGVTLDVDAGTVVKMPPGRAWNYNDVDVVVNGTLNLNGSLENPIVFSSYYDDTAGSDTNVDGIATVPLRGDWGRIRFNSGSRGTLSGVDLRWGGGGNAGVCCTAQPATDAILSVDATLDIADAVIAQSQARGAWISAGLGTITDSTFRDNATWGLSFSTNITCANWTVTNALFSGNGTGDEECP